MKIIVDTSILIDYIRGGSAWENFIENAGEDTELYLSTIVIYELFSGESTKKPQHTQALNYFLRQFQRIDLTEEIARMAGELYRDINKKLGIADYIIAASAINLDGYVLTLNKKHFQEIPNLRLNF